MAYAHETIEVNPIILSADKFIEFKREFCSENPTCILNCGNNTIDIKGKKKQVQKFKDYLNNYYLDPTKIDIKLRSGKKFRALNDEQKELMKLITEKEITFVSGSAGTGKTMVSVILTAYMLKKRKIDKIVLTRPAVEADGEKLGHLPGTIKDKMLPYLMPLYDYLEMVFTKEEIEAMELAGKIEIIPLSFMRGRSLSNTVILVDEAQNASYEQFKMITTRIGHNSKIIFSGDITQNDLSRKESGLAIYTDLFRDHDQFGVLEFTNDAIVRNPIIKHIIAKCDAYEDSLKKRRKPRKTKKEVLLETNTDD